MKILFAAAVPLALAGCSQPFVPPVVTSLVEAANPATARIAPDGPVVGHSSRAIEEPGDWRSLNDAQALGATR